METAVITNEVFDAELINILGKMTAAQIITIPGVYEILSEEFNNEVLDNLHHDDESADDSDTWPISGEDNGAQIMADNAATGRSVESLENVAVIEHRGQQFKVSPDAMEALADYGDRVAAGEMTSEDAVECILKAEGYNIEPAPKTANP